MSGFGSRLNWNGLYRFVIVILMLDVLVGVLVYVDSMLLVQVIIIMDRFQRFVSFYLGMLFIWGVCYSLMLFRQGGYGCNMREGGKGIYK